MKRFGSKPSITPEIQAKITKAAELGKKAFEEGRPCIPALDVEFNVACITGLKVGEGLPVLDAWMGAWTKANLAAPVLGMDALPEDRGNYRADRRR